MEALASLTVPAPCSSLSIGSVNGRADSFRTSTHQRAVHMPAVSLRSLSSSHCRESLRQNLEVNVPSTRRRHHVLLQTIAAVAQDTSAPSTEAEEVLDATDRNYARFVRAEEVAPGLRNVVLEVETSRELIPLEEAYTSCGLKAEIMAGGTRYLLTPTSAPFPMSVNEPVLYKMRGDIPAGATKALNYRLSAKAELELLVSEKEHPELFAQCSGDGPGADHFQLISFVGDRRAMRPVQFLPRSTTLILIARGADAATARAAIEATTVGGLDIGLRKDVRLYYSASSDGEILFKDRHSQWADIGVKILTTTDSAGAVAGIKQLFDDDDLMYDPETTGAVICGPEAAAAGAKGLFLDADFLADSIVELS